MELEDIFTKRVTEFAAQASDLLDSFATSSFTGKSARTSASANRSSIIVQINGSEDKTILLPRHDRTSTFTGLGYLTDFVLPNVYFHVTTAYAILRHNGVEIGKKDFLGDVG